MGITTRKRMRADSKRAQQQREKQEFLDLQYITFQLRDTVHEQWKEIPDWPYEVSTFKRVRHKPTKTLIKPSKRMVFLQDGRKKMQVQIDILWRSVWKATS